MKEPKPTINRLRRIEGQVRGVAQMLEDDRYCIDILHQVQAVKSALAKVESQILKDHAACCVNEAIDSPATLASSARSSTNWSTCSSETKR